MSHQSASARQLTFDELDTPLRETTFVVVDLETTGSRSGDDAITEIGAVKIRGGRILGELATLVDPGRTVPPYIVELTGITSAMLIDAPRIERVLPSFLEFARGAVLVAHNAPFDIGFLKAAAAQCQIPWPSFQVLCTVKLARRVLTREEAPSVKLSALASLFAVATLPTHRALDDAKATVDVLHGLFERVGNLGVHSYPELVDFLPNVSSAQRGKRGLAAHLPRTPGVYLFRGPSDEVLYVGTAVNLQRRVRGYFTGSETRARMKEMVALATRVDHVECAHGLEASVRELRLLAAHAPPYNRRSKYPRKAWWIILTDEPFPRLSVTRRATVDAFGPFTSRTDAADIAATLTEVCRLRSCTKKIREHQPHGPGCLDAAAVGCPAGSSPQSPAEYGPAPEAARRLVLGSDDEPLRRLRGRIEEMAAAELFENAARLRDRTAALATALRRTQRLASVAVIDELVAARPRDGGGWELAVIRAGRLASAGVAVPGVAPMPIVDALTLAAETVLDDPSPLRGATAGEVGLVASWLDSPGVRIVRTSAGYAEPVRGGGAWQQWCALARGVTA